MPIRQASATCLAHLRNADEAHEVDITDYAAAEIAGPGAAVMLPPPPPAVVAPAAAAAAQPAVEAEPLSSGPTREAFEALAESVRQR